jgi:hypothetical protein
MSEPEAGAARGGPVTVRIFGSLHTLRTERGLPTTVEFDVPVEGMSARDIAVALELPREMIEGVFCNGHVFGLGRSIVPGDRIGFVPHGTPGPHRFMLGLWKAGQEDEEEGG